MQNRELEHNHTSCGFCGSARFKPRSELTADERTVADRLSSSAALPSDLRDTAVYCARCLNAAPRPNGYTA